MDALEIVCSETGPWPVATDGFRIVSIDSFHFPARLCAFLVLYYVLALLVHVWFCYARFSCIGISLSDWLGRTSQRTYFMSGGM